VAEYHVENFGCRASRADGEAIAAGLRHNGLVPAEAPASAHVVIVNTCSVTAEADRQARAWIRRARRQNPAARLIVTGCYAQRAPQELAALPEVDAVIGNSHKSMVPSLALEFANQNSAVIEKNTVLLSEAGTMRLPAVHDDRPRAVEGPPEAGVPGAPAVGVPGWEGESVAQPPIRISSGVILPETESAVGLIPPSVSEAPAFVPLSKILHDDAFAHAELATLPFAPDSHQTRPNLKVQDGCGNRCSFCIIPTTRGPSRSIPLATCLDNVRRYVDQGGQELVLSGINLGRWGRDLQPARRFEVLVAAILRETQLPRLRLSSIEPMDWSADLLALYLEFAIGHEADKSARPAADARSTTAPLNAVPCTLIAELHPAPCTLYPAFHPRLARHAHLPLQSGSDAILRRMYRRYRPWHYAERLAQIRELLPDAAIGADVMIGFPGETGALFDESYRFIAAQPFTYLHLFPFSARPGTPAWELHRQNPVPARAVHERMSALRALIEEKSRAFRSGFIGRTLSAVTIEPGPGSTTHAVTDNFLKLTLDGSIPANRLVTAHIIALSADGLHGTTAPIH
jgi:threonylcarbamoyladenosine tRNA methylthiotransferase MtaB